MARAKKPPKPKKMRDPSHADLIKAIRDLLKACNIWHFKHWSGPFSVKGISDILGIFRGQFLAIEVKTKTDGFQDGQEEFIWSVNRAGGLAFVARSVEDVIEKLELGDRFLDLK
ncbi:MAG: VRR-NUC domain-containing protein [Methanoregula sp.]|jgi:hypothetical protein